MAATRAVAQSEQARYGEGRDSDPIDRLSNLPDVVLHRILSRISIKDAVMTSLLSKRWQHLWPFIPKLGFCQREFRSRSNFMNLVERALLLRDSFSVERFFLSCDAESDMVRINSWIACLVRRNIQDLYMKICPGQERLVFPSCLFTCVTLTRLEISFGPPQDLIMPSSVCLSSLKDLRLGRVRLVDYGSVQNLLFSCPALESFTLTNCHCMDLNGKTISAPNLQRLAIYDLLTHVSDVEGKVVINGPNVKRFTYYGISPYAYRLVGSSSLSEASLCFPCTSYYDLDMDFDWCSDLFQGLYNVASLSLSVFFFLGVTGEDVFQGLPIFCNMTKLKLDLGEVFLGSKALAALLTKSPCLRILEIDQGVNDDQDLEVSRALEPVPPCFLSQLKKIIIHSFSPTKVNIDSVALLLGKAMVLEEMVLYYPEPTEGDYNLEHLKELPRGSRNCKISLVQETK